LCNTTQDDRVGDLPDLEIFYFGFKHRF
jgi:hypothetical protein